MWMNGELQKGNEPKSSLCVRIYLGARACERGGGRKRERNANPTYLGSSISTSDLLAYRAGNVQNHRHIRRRGEQNSGINMES